MTGAKMQLVRGWLTKAQRDLASARVLAASTPPLPDTAIYHCQQAAEKAIKGYLVFRDHQPEHTHDIELLLRTAALYADEFASWIDLGIEYTLASIVTLDLQWNQSMDSLSGHSLPQKNFTSLSFLYCRRKFNKRSTF